MKFGYKKSTIHPGEGTTVVEQSLSKKKTSVKRAGELFNFIYCSYVSVTVTSPHCLSQ